MMKKSSHSLYSALQKIGKLLFVTTLISCGGGAGEGGSGDKTSSTNSNSDVKPAPIISPEAPVSQKAPQNRMSIQEKNNYLNTYLKLTKVNTAHQQGYKGAGVKIGVIDDGNIPDIPELAGKNIVNIGDQDQIDKEAHGPTVLAIIDGHTTENFNGGVAPESELFYYNLKQRWVNESGSEYSKKGYFVRSIQPEEIYEKMLEHRVKIINHSISISSHEEDPNLKQSSAYGEMLVKNNPGFIDVLKYSIDQGHLHIWAAGNSQDNGRHDPETGGLPALVPELEKGWIVVVGMNNNKTLNQGSLRCMSAKAFCIGAPYSIFIPAMNGTNRSRSGIQNGTSMSSPIVSGIAALIWGKYPWMDANNVRQTLLSSGSYEIPNEKLGWGLVNAEKAINGPSRFDKKLTGASKNNTAFFVANVDMAPKNWDNNSIYKKQNLNLLQSYAFNNQIVGDAGLIKQGQGPLWLTGNNDYEGGTQVKQGSLFLSGALTSDIDIDKNAFFISQGARVNADINNSGTLVGLKKNDEDDRALKVNGNLNVNDNATLVSEVNSLIQVNGNLVLNNAALKVLSTDTVQTVTYKALTAKNIDGSFISEQVIDKNGSILHTYSITSTVSKRALSLTLHPTFEEVKKLWKNDKTRQNVALRLENTLNQLTYEPKESAAHQELKYVLNTSNTEKLGNILDSYSGQLYASGLALSFKQSAMINRVLGHRLDQLGQNSNHLGMWFELYKGQWTLKKTGFSTGKTHFWGGQWGLDGRLNENWIIGGALLAGDGRADFNRFGGSAQSRNTGISFYGRYGKNEGWYTAGRLGLAYIDRETKRKIITHDQKMMNARHVNRLWSGYLETGYSVARGDQYRITPFLGFAYDRLTRGAFAEKEAPYGLRANSANYAHAAGSIGLRFNQPIHWLYRAWIQAYGLYQRSLKATDLSYRATFIGLPSSNFLIEGINLHKNSGWVGIGLNIQWTSFLSWQASYNTQLEGNGQISHLFNTGFRINLSCNRKTI